MMMLLRLEESTRSGWSLRWAWVFGRVRTDWRVVAVDAQEVAVGQSEGGKRGAQNIARARRRRRRPNITGAKRTVEVVLSEEEFAMVQRFADEANMTVPWYLVQAAVNPVPSAAAAKDGKPWLPWPKRQALAGLLVSATSALDAIRLEQLAKIGGHFNQIARSANIGGTVDEDILETN
ncbi:hypothetical protein ABZ540_35970, partial [Nocardia xishanensis]|uniref:hypothetical protein n=1 Tax=Nocardia xishanensis TaxID=238964 RepID=UPI0033C2BD9D